MRQEAKRIAGRIARLELLGQRGALAELRRLDRVGDGPPPEAFWTLIDAAGVSTEREQFWQELLPMMVTCPHAPGRLAGRELRGSGVEPLIPASRIERWLRLGKRPAWRELRKMLHRIERVDWQGLSELLLVWNEEQKRAFARSYFRRRRATSESQDREISSISPASLQ